MDIRCTLQTTVIHTTFCISSSILLLFFSQMQMSAVYAIVCTQHNECEEKSSDKNKRENTFLCMAWITKNDWSFFFHSFFCDSVRNHLHSVWSVVAAVEIHSIFFFIVNILEKSRTCTRTRWCMTFLFGDILLILLWFILSSKIHMCVRRRRGQQSLTYPKYTVIFHMRSDLVYFFFFSIVRSRLVIHCRITHAF